MKPPSASTRSELHNALLPGNMPQISISGYEGPLDLLLQLIRANKMEITDIPIANITSQYLSILQAMESLNLAVAGEYIVMAATLLEIKSRILLPNNKCSDTEEQEDPRAELVERLLEYETYQGSLELMRRRESDRRELYFRSMHEHLDDYLLPASTAQLSPGMLFLALNRLLSEAGLDDKPITTIIPKRRVNLKLKMTEILYSLRNTKGAGLLFEALFALPCPRQDIVMSFLAVLELMRLGRIRAEVSEDAQSFFIYLEAAE